MATFYLLLFTAPQKLMFLSLRVYDPAPSSEGAYTGSFFLSKIPA
jgi:hypothetical protein